MRCFYTRMDHQTHSQSRWLRFGLSACAAVSLVTTANAGSPPPAPVQEAADWKVNTIAPVTNPIFFEDPVIRSEIRPIFVYHNFSDSFITGRGRATLTALQFRYAITDRLAFIATQDGYMNINSVGLGSQDGWMDLARASNTPSSTTSPTSSSSHRASRSTFPPATTTSSRVVAAVNGIPLCRSPKAMVTST